MNQQTEALAKQAAEYAIEFATQDQEQYIPKLLEKFAELIVRECAEWLKQPVNQTPLSGAVMNIAADRLKEHFGVGE